DLSRRARRILDDANLKDISIFASGNLDEFKISELVDSRAPIDGFGIGAALSTVDDAPDAEFTYKLVQYAGQGRIKTSSGKVSTPCEKQIFRAFAESGAPVVDLVGLAAESVHTVAREFGPVPAKISPMLSPIIENGRRTIPRPTLAELRE